MNTKIIIGIFLPVVLVFVLVGLSASNIGLEIKKETIETVNFGNIFASYNDYNNPVKYVPIQTITIVNDFFMPRVQELENVIICAVDDSNSPARFAFQTRYSETKYSEPVYNLGLMEASAMGRSYYYGGSSGKATVKMSARSAKTVTLFIESQRVYQDAYGAANLAQYGSYTKLLLIEKPKSNNNYYDCNNLPAEQLAKATEIPIIS